MSDQLLDQHDQMVERMKAYWIEEFPDTPFPEIFLAGTRLLLGLLGTQDGIAQAQRLHAFMQQWKALEG